MVRKGCEGEAEVESGSSVVLVASKVIVIFILLSFLKLSVVP